MIRFPGFLAAAISSFFNSEICLNASVRAMQRNQEQARAAALYSHLKRQSTAADGDPSASRSPRIFEARAESHSDEHADAAAASWSRLGAVDCGAPVWGSNWGRAPPDRRHLRLENPRGAPCQARRSQGCMTCCARWPLQLALTRDCRASLRHGLPHGVFSNCCCLGQ